MNFQRWLEVAARMSFDHSPMKVTLFVKLGDRDDVELRCRLDSADHGDGSPIKVWIIERVSATYDYTTRDMVEVLAKLVRRAFDHEAREFTRFDGEVFDDPHRDDVGREPARRAAP